MSVAAADKQTLMGTTNTYLVLSPADATYEFRERDDTLFIGPWRRLAVALGFDNYSVAYIRASLPPHELIVSKDWLGLSPSGLLRLCADKGHARQLLLCISEENGWKCPVRGLQRCLSHGGSNSIHPLLPELETVVFDSSPHVLERCLLAMFALPKLEHTERLLSQLTALASKSAQPSASSSATIASSPPSSGSASIAVPNSGVSAAASADGLSLHPQSLLPDDVIFVQSRDQLVDHDQLMTDAAKERQPKCSARSVSSRIAGRVVEPSE